jgi:hypothetical protein
MKARQVLSDEDRVRRGQRAADAMAFMEDIFEGVRVYLLESIETTSPSDSAAILEQHRGLQNLAKVKKALELCISDGQIANAISESQLRRG